MSSIRLSTIRCVRMNLDPRLRSSTSECYRDPVKSVTRVCWVVVSSCIVEYVGVLLVSMVRGVVYVSLGAVGGSVIIVFIIDPEKFTFKP